MHIRLIIILIIIHSLRFSAYFDKILSHNFSKIFIHYDKIPYFSSDSFLRLLSVKALKA